MLSFPRYLTREKPGIPRLARLLFVVLCLRSIHGATLREHRLREGDSDSLQSPDSDMIKALEYIESLHQRTDSQDKPLLSMGNDADEVDDAQRIGTMLRLAPDPTRARNDEEEDDADVERSDDKSEELLQAVLSTLQQTEKAPKTALLRPSSLEGGDAKSAMYPRVQKQKGIMPHKKMPLMFEDDEEGLGEEEEDHESPFKRTNENVEEKYTPQTLATLQSVFDELDKFTNAKASHKRQEEDTGEEEEEEDEGEEGEDLFNLRNVVYDDDEGEDLANWGPSQEQGEEGEEEEDDRQELDRSLDYVDDEEQNEEENERYPVRRSNDPDQVDYYILKVLERTEEEEQKRAIEEEEQKRAARRVSQYREYIDPRVIHQLLQISQKYRIPPEDLLGVLKTEETLNQGKKQQSRDKNQVWKTSTKKIYGIPQDIFFSRRLPGRNNFPQNLQKDAILNILGLNRDQSPIRKPYRSSRLHTLTAGRTGDAAPTLRRLPPSKTKDYDDTADGELAAYMAAQMLPRYPGLAYRYGKTGQKRDEAGQSMAGSFEQAMQDYLDQMDSDKEAEIKRQSEDNARGDNRQEFDNNAMMKLMTYLNPESEDSEIALKGI